MASRRSHAPTYTSSSHASMNSWLSILKIVLWEAAGLRRDAIASYSLPTSLKKPVFMYSCQKPVFMSSCQKTCLHVFMSKNMSSCQKQQNSRLGTPCRLTALMRHDVQHHFVGAVHCFGTDAGEIADGTVYVVVDDAFHRRHALAFH